MASYKEPNGTVRDKVPGQIVSQETIHKRYEMKWYHTTDGYYRKVREKALLPMNNYQHNTEEINTPLGTAWKQNRYDFTLGGYSNLQHSATATSAVGGHLFNVTPRPGNQVEGKAIANLYANADSADLDALVTAAEAPKTMAMIGSTAKRIAGILRSLKRGDPVSALQSLGIGSGKHSRQINRKANSARRNGTLDKFASSTWLEIKYGWKPLLSSIEDAVDATGQDWFNHPADIRITGSSKTEFNPNSNALLSNSLIYGGSIEGEIERKHKYVVYVQILDPNLRNANSIGLLNLGSVAWELIPYSFVFDWFVPVGDFVAAQTAFFGTAFESGTSTFSNKHDIRATMTSNSGLPCNLFEEQKLFTITREKIYSLPSSTKILNSKDFSKLLNFDKVVTGLALLNQLR